MDQGPLVNEQIDAGRELAVELGSGYKPLQTALWLKESDSENWFLYLASDQIDDSNFDLAYGEVLRLLGPGPYLWLDPFQVKVRGVDDPLVKDVLEIQRKYPANIARRIRNRMLGGLSIEEAYLYAMPITVSS